MANHSDEKDTKELLETLGAEEWPTLAVLDRRYIDLVLDRMGGNKTRAAEVLGIDRRTLNRIFAREREACVARQALEDELFSELSKPRKIARKA